MGIVGANGAGKSTLINAISGLLQANVRHDDCSTDMDLTKMSAHDIVRAGVVQVPEGRNLFPEMTVYENLLVGRQHKRAKAERSENFDEVFTLFPRLKERESQLARTLSGGEQQMVAVGAGDDVEPAHPDHGRAVPRPRTHRHPGDLQGGRGSCATWG